MAAAIKRDHHAVEKRHGYAMENLTQPVVTQGGYLLTTPTI